MKKCPFCKADIEDNARFCLYCMKPLNEKEVIASPQNKKRWWLLVLVVPVLLVALLLSFMLRREEKTSMRADTTGGESESHVQTTDLQEGESSAETTWETQSGGNVQQEEPTAGENPQPSEPANGNQNNNDQKPVIRPSQPEGPTENTSAPTEAEEPTEETTEETTEKTTEETTEETTKQEPPAVAAAYSYRAARAGDDFNANYTNSGNDIVITGIFQPSANGTYDIPAYIDGKKVIAIVANAFSGSNAKVVYVPATMKTIWNYAFAGCGLTDIYFRGSAIYVESKAFSGALTIHCSASCSDRDFHYYKNCAASYGATWQEWNG